MSDHDGGAISEVEDFTEAEIGDLNALFRAMNDAHRAELGDFERFGEYGGRYSIVDADPDIEENKLTLLLLRRIRSCIADGGGGGDGDAGAALRLHFDGVCDYSMGFSSSAEDPDLDVWDEVLEHYCRMNAKCYLARQFSRGKDTLWRNIAKMFQSCSHQKNVIEGLGHLIHSLPPEANLVSLHLTRNIIKCNDVIVVCNAFKGMANLTELDLSYNAIRGAGGAELFSTLLGHPSCNLRRLNLAFNPLGGSGSQEDGPFTLALVKTLRDTNRSLVELDLTWTAVGLCPAIVDIFVPFPSEKDWDVFNYADNRNHHLQVLKLDSIVADDTQEGQLLQQHLQARLRVNAAGPAPALEAKIERYFAKDIKRTFYDKTPDQVARCLELIGRHGNLFTLMTAVRHFQAQGLLVE